MDVSVSAIAFGVLVSSRASFWLDKKTRKFFECFNEDLPKLVLIPLTEAKWWTFLPGLILISDGHLLSAGHSPFPHWWPLNRGSTVFSNRNMENSSIRNPLVLFSSRSSLRSIHVLSSRTSSHHQPRGRDFHDDRFHSGWMRGSRSTTSPRGVRWHSCSPHGHHCPDLEL